MEIAPNIRLVGLLGEGGMGSVWIADHLGLATQVAVKFIAPHLARRHPAIRERFAREARAAARIRDPHVVQIFDYGVMGTGTPYIVMELLQGETLAEHLHRSGPLPLADVCTMVMQTSGALAKAHALGIVHRDLKPDNLFLTDAAGGLFVKILDFGVAKLADEAALALTGTHAVFGTPQYMSPEQLGSARDVDGRADVWALAVSAYQMLTGRLPFDGPTPVSVARAVCSGKFAPPSTHRPSLPRTVDAFFRRAFALEPDARFTNVGAFGRALVDAISMDLEPVTIPSSRTDEITCLTTDARPARRRRRTWVTAATVLVAMGAVAFSAGERKQRTLAPLAPIPTPAARAQPEQASKPKVEAQPIQRIKPTIRRACADPFFVDAQGIKRVKRQCL
jgi:serine/threonine-protein kinase